MMRTAKYAIISSAAALVASSSTVDVNGLKLTRVAGASSIKNTVSAVEDAPKISDAFAGLPLELEHKFLFTLEKNIGDENDAGLLLEFQPKFLSTVEQNIGDDAEDRDNKAHFRQQKLNQLQKESAF